MNDQNWLTDQFETYRKHLQAVAYRMLGSKAEAEDAVQESWLRFCHVDSSNVQNMGGWLTTVVSRVCLDMMRSRKSRREDLTGSNLPEPVVWRSGAPDPQEEASLADSVGLAMLVVLDRLTPAERVAFVLHDIFALSFTEIAPVINRTEVATRKLASRARRRVRGTESVLNTERMTQKRLVEAFLSAARNGDFVALLNVLDPDVLLRNDPTFIQTAASVMVHGAESVAKQFLGRAQEARPILINGDVGAIVAPLGQVHFVLKFTMRGRKITEIELIADAALVRQLSLSALLE